MDRVNLTKIYRKHLYKCHNVPPQYKNIKKNKRLALGKMIYSLVIVLQSVKELTFTSI
jgi:hypothetical protein